MNDNFQIRFEVDKDTGRFFLENDLYKQMMYRWGAGSILHLLKWYEYIEYYEGCHLIKETINKHNILVDDNVPLRLE